MADSKAITVAVFSKSRYPHQICNSIPSFAVRQAKNQFLSHLRANHS